MVTVVLEIASLQKHLKVTDFQMKTENSEIPKTGNDCMLQSLRKLFCNRGVTWLQWKSTFHEIGKLAVLSVNRVIPFIPDRRSRLQVGATAPLDDSLGGKGTATIIVSSPSLVSLLLL